MKGVHEFLQEQHELITARADRLDGIIERFRAFGFEIGTPRSTLELTPDTAEAILDRLEDPS